eukprot:4876907-Prymnesium_polylepis.1
MTRTVVPPDYPGVVRALCPTRLLPAPRTYKGAGRAWDRCVGLVPRASMDARHRASRASTG